MATITLEYNSRNKLARKTIDYILSLGVFHTKEITKSKLDISLAEADNGDVHKAKNAKDLVENCIS